MGLLSYTAWHHNPADELLELYKECRGKCDVTTRQRLRTVAGIDDGGVGRM